jgi:hypothetical protein
VVPQEICAARVPKGGVLSDGFEVLKNTSSSEVVVQKVTLVDAHALRIVAAYVVPITGYDLYGARDGYPPAPHLDPGVLWSKRQVAAGAHIPHSQGHHVSNLVVVLQPGVSGGTARAVAVYYQVSGQQYVMRTSTRIPVVVGEQCPSG